MDTVSDDAIRAVMQVCVTAVRDVPDSAQDEAPDEAPDTEPETEPDTEELNDGR